MRKWTKEEIEKQEIQAIRMHAFGENHGLQVAWASIYRRIAKLETRCVELDERIVEIEKKLTDL